MSFPSLNAAIPYDDARYQPSSQAGDPIPAMHLGFGETSDGKTITPIPMTTTQKMKLVGLIVLAGLTLMAAGALIATGLGAGIAACVASSLILGMQMGALSGAGLGLIAITAIVFLVKSRTARIVPSTNDFKFPDAAPRLGEFHQDNAVLVSQNGKETAEWRDKLFGAAQQSIEWSGNFLGGKIFRNTLNLIQEKMTALPNLQVHIFCSHDLLEAADVKKLEQLKKDFPEQFHLLVSDTKITTSPDVSSLENHVKMVVVDRKYFITGGTGHHDVLSDQGETAKAPAPDASFKSKGVGSGSRDMDIVGSGNVALTMSQEFFKLWAIWQHRMSPNNKSSIADYNRYFPLSSESPRAVVRTLDYNPKLVQKAKVKVLVCGDPNQPANACTEELVRIINSAKKSIKLAQLSFNPTKEIWDALLSASERGVSIDLITNGLNKKSGAGMYFITPSNRQQYLPLMLGRNIRKLDKKGDLARSAKKAVNVYEYNLDGIIMHAKLVSVDGKIASLGSYNLGQKSHRGDYEMDVTMMAPEVDDLVPPSELTEGHEKAAKEADEAQKSLVEQCDEVFESMKSKSKLISFDEAYKFRTGIFHRLYGKIMQWHVTANFGG